MLYTGRVNTRHLHSKILVIQDCQERGAGRGGEQGTQRSPADPARPLLLSPSWLPQVTAAHVPQYIAEDTDVFGFELTVAEMATLAAI